MNTKVELKDEELEKVTGGVKDKNGNELHYYDFVSTPYEYVANHLPPTYYEWCTQLQGFDENQGTAYIRLYSKTSRSGNYRFVDFGGVPLNELSFIDCPTWLGM